MSRLLVTSASGSNGHGYGAVLAFTPDGDLIAPFSDDDRITDPRGLNIHPTNGMVYLSSGPDRLLALDLEGTVTLDSGQAVVSVQ
jgi:hypothetical protein